MTAKLQFQSLRHQYLDVFFLKNLVNILLTLGTFPRIGLAQYVNFHTDTLQRFLRPGSEGGGEFILIIALFYITQGFVLTPFRTGIQHFALHRSFHHVSVRGIESQHQPQHHQKQYFHEPILSGPHPVKQALFTRQKPLAKPDPTKDYSPSVSYLRQAKKVFDIQIESLSHLKSRLDGNFSLAVDCLLDSLQRKNKIILTGVGKSGHIGEKIAATFTSTGAPAVVLNPLNAMHGDLGMVSKGDVILALSYSGETEELLRILPNLKRAQAKIIALTGQPQSTLARNADLHLDVSVPREACPHNLAPTSSTTAMLVLGDALAMVVLSTRGFKKDDFARFHPGGSLGRHLLLKVQDVMRPADQVVISRGSDTVRQALAAMTAKRCGAAMIVDAKGKLIGIYTHGDFARSFQTDASIGTTPLQDVMIRNPISVQIDKLAAEVLNIFEKHRIEDLVVVNHRNQPIGLIDVQDLTKLKLL
ncbi:MAG: KpsF/GutQ family sugar-phosphate isomerase [Blastochloris sp.]|nr:KpsF/GutQ family sugar-phosphate isomerase [Blastochloris sp.]